RAALRAPRHGSQCQRLAVWLGYVGCPSRVRTGWRSLLHHVRRRRSGAEDLTELIATDALVASGPLTHSCVKGVLALWRVRAHQAEVRRHEGPPVIAHVRRIGLASLRLTFYPP